MSKPLFEMTCKDGTVVKIDQPTAAYYRVLRVGPVIAGDLRFQQEELAQRCAALIIEDCGGEA